MHCLNPKMIANVPKGLRFNSDSLHFFAIISTELLANAITKVCYVALDLITWELKQDTRPNPFCYASLRDQSQSTEDFSPQQATLWGAKWCLKARPGWLIETPCTIWQEFQISAHAIVLTRRPTV